MIGVLMIPFVLLPSLSGYSLGLLRHIGVPELVQNVMALLSCANVLISILAIFENRFHIVCTYTWKSYWEPCRRYWTVAHYISLDFCSMGVFCTGSSGSQEKVLEQVPCLPQYIKDGPIFVISEDWTYHLIALVSFLLFGISECGFFIICLIFSIFQQVRSKKISRRTFQLQVKFFMALMIQMGAPAFMLVVPLTYVWVAILYNYYDQMYSNFVIIAETLHGLSSTVVMILIHYPYRAALFNMIWKRKKNMKKGSSRCLCSRNSNAPNNFQAQMNYSCIPDVGYLDSPEFLSLALHINTGISTPIHLFGFYCILLKTTKQMKSAMWYLVNLHVWVVLFDYSFSILTIPFLLLPFFAGHPLGILRYFGVSTLFQIVLVLVFLANMLVSISMVFENRFYTLCTFPGKSHWKHWRRVWVVLFHISGCACFISYYFLVPDQETAKRNMYQKLPCLPRSLYEADNFVLTEDITYHLLIFVTFCAVMAVKTLFFAFSLVWNGVQQLKQKTLSHKTFQLHKSFMIALGTQVTVPLALLAIPGIYLWMAMINVYYNQAYTHISVTMLSMHGFTSSFVMILAHRPYRTALLDIGRRKRKVSSEESSRKGIQYHHRNLSAVNE
ncbi:unnamed protein product [Caenorhabditis brenneri]